MLYKKTMYGTDTTFFSGTGDQFKVWDMLSISLTTKLYLQPSPNIFSPRLIESTDVEEMLCDNCTFCVCVERSSFLSMIIYEIYSSCINSLFIAEKYYSS